MKNPADFFRNAFAGRKKWILPGLLLSGVLLLALAGGGKKTAVGDSDRAAFAARTEQALEERIQKLLNTVDGVSGAHVLVTIERLEPAPDDGASGAFTLTGGTGTVYLPVVRGVAVTCRGGDSPVVRQRIVGLLSACLGVGENRISVAPG
ncbi:MAG: hypothetical protein IK104_09350 [Clostridia bacterium]|nr:hypothetical protein [Clostridia bacterium]